MSESADKKVCITESHEGARLKLQRQIDEGEGILTRPINNQHDFELAEQAFEQWHEYTSTLLSKLFTTQQKRRQFVSQITTSGAYADFQGKCEEFRRNVGKYLNTLRSITGTLELFDVEVATGITPLSDKVEVVRSRKVVFVVHGRNEKLKNSMFDFLRAIGLEPREWTQVLAEAIKETGSGAPYIGDILDVAFRKAWAAVVLVTGDDYAKLRVELASEGEADPETKLTPQARPNVIFEAGMAIAKYEDRTILVEIGKLRPWSDIRGRYTIRLDNSPEKKKELVEVLKAVGCAVDDSGTSWLKMSGFFETPLSEQEDRNRQETTIASEESATTEKQLLLAQAKHLKERIVRTIEAGETTLAPDFAIELDRLFLPAYFEWGRRQEIVSIKLEFEALSTAKLRNRVELLNTTLNSVERLIALMEKLR